MPICKITNHAALKSCFREMAQLPTYMDMQWKESVLAVLTWIEKLVPWH